MLLMPPDAYMLAATQLDPYIHSLFDKPHGVEVSNSVIEAYSPIHYNNSDVAARAKFQGDYFFSCAENELTALAARKVKGNVYRYIFARFSNMDVASLSGLINLTGIGNYPFVKNWASHTAEIPFVFGNLNYTYLGSASASHTVADVMYSQEIMSRWTSFAKNGTPTATSSEIWTSVPRTLYDQSLSSDSMLNVPTLFFQPDDIGNKMDHSSNFQMYQCSSIPGMIGMPETNTVSAAIRAHKQLLFYSNLFYFILLLVFLLF